MDKIEKIRQEIEQNIQAIKVLNEHTTPEQTSKTCAIFQYSVIILSELLSFIDSLSEEPDKSLEEAAENWTKSVYGNPGLSAVSISGVFGFKAGAEWQKEQMMKESVEGEAEELYNDGESQCTVNVGTYFKPGEKVYVLKAKEKNK